MVSHKQPSVKEYTDSVFPLKRSPANRIISQSFKVNQRCLFCNKMSTVLPSNSDVKKHEINVHLNLLQSAHVSNDRRLVSRVMLQLKKVRKLLNAELAFKLLQTPYLSGKKGN